MLTATLAGLAALAAGVLAVVVWGIATSAMGREFERLGLPGDIVTALSAELDARYRASRCGTVAR